MARSATKDSHDTSPRNLGRYRLYGELAAGGMATVHFGRQVGSGGFSKLVAIKRLHPQFGKVEEFVEMFLAEARLASRIRHPNVVQPLDVLRVDDEVFLVMEYVEGDSLSRLMKATIARQEKVPLGVAVAIASGVLRGLHAAHEAKSDKGEPLGIVHRDVSPQNILVGVDGTPRVIDFGIAKAADSVQITREGELKGKLAYIAPEILSGQRGTRRADIYAAAIVLWEVITAQRLFDADYQSAVLANILHRPVDPPSDFVPGLPPELDRVVMKGLARDPSDRFATAREMAVALEEAAPAASAATVGEWVEVIASISLANRGRRVAQIEALPTDEDEEAEEVLSELMTISAAEPPSVSAVGPSHAALSAGPSGRVSAVPPPPPPPRPRAEPARVSAPPPEPTVPRSATAVGLGPEGAKDSLPAAPPPAPEPAPPPRTAAPIESTQMSAPDAPAPPPRPRNATLPSASSPMPSSALPPPNIVVDASPVDAAPAWPVPGIAPAAAGTTVLLGPQRRSSGGGIVAVILALALAAAVLYVGLPEYLKRSYASAAAAEGVTMTIDSVQVSMRHVRLVGVTATMADLPGLTLTAKSLEVWFSFRLDATDAVVHEATLKIDATESAVADNLRRATKAHEWKGLREGTLQRVAIDAGQLVWSRALGEGTQVEVQNLSMEIEKNGHDRLGDDLSFQSPLVTVTVPWGKVGPWIAEGQVDHGRTKATLTLDPSGANKAALSVVMDGPSVTALDLTLPRANAASYGVSNALLGRRPDDVLYAEGNLHYAVASASKVEASASLVLSGARLAGAPSSAERASIKGDASGDPSQPIEISRGELTFGSFHGPLSGQVTIGPGYVRADVGWRTGGVSCPGGGVASLGGGLVFDTRSLGDARFGVVPNVKCGLKILPP